MRRNALLKKSASRRGGSGENRGDDDLEFHKPEIMESAFRPELANQTNRVREFLEEKKVDRQRYRQEGFRFRLKRVLIYLFSPVQGENFTPTNPWIAHPTSIASSTMLIISGTLLIYSAIQTDPILIKFNVFVDTFFVFEILFNFIVGTWHKGEYQEKMATIAWLYLKGRFFFDAVTSIPTSWIELHGWKSCGNENATAVSSDAVADAMRFLRLLKPLRLTKLLRIIKFAKIFDILDRVLRISPQVVQIAKLIFGVALLVHFLSCIFWLIKTEYDPNFKEFSERWEVGESTSRKWLLAMYFVNTVFTTVGFGDISGTNDVERVFCIIVMWVGTAVFAVIINKLQRAAAEMNERNREKNQEIKKVVRFMREHKAPAWMEQEVRTWLNFHIDRITAKRERHQVLWSLPPKLRNQVVLQINSRAFRNAWVFGRLTHSDATKFITDLVLHTSNHIIAKGQLIASDKINCALPSLPGSGHHEQAKDKNMEGPVKFASDNGTFSSKTTGTVPSSMPSSLTTSKTRRTSTINKTHSPFAVDSNVDTNLGLRTQSTILEPEPVVEQPRRPEDQQLYIVEVGSVVATVWVKGENRMLESKTLTKGHFFGERRLLLEDDAKGGWGFYEDVEFEFRAIENSEIITLTKETFQQVVSKYPAEILKEIEFESGRMWGASDVHIEDLRLRIELDRIADDSEFAKSRRARLQWEKFSFRLIAKHTKDVAIADLLFNFSLPTKTADPMAAMRARPDWSAGSLRNSRRNSMSWRPNTRSSSSAVIKSTSRGSRGEGHAKWLGGPESLKGSFKANGTRTATDGGMRSPSSPKRSGSSPGEARDRPSAASLRPLTADAEADRVMCTIVDDKVEVRRASLVSTFANMVQGRTRSSHGKSQASASPPASNGPAAVVSANLVLVDRNSVDGSGRTMTSPVRLPSASLNIGESWQRGSSHGSQAQ